MAHSPRRSCGVTAVEKDLTEDVVGTALVKSLTVRDGLKERFLSRMSRVLHMCVSIRENAVEKSVDVFLLYRDLEQRDMIEKELRDVEGYLTSIAKLPRGASLKKSEEELWDAFLVCSYDDTRAAICLLNRSFKDYQDIFADFITTMFGFDTDYSHSESDLLLGGRIIELSQAVQVYDESMKETNKLIHVASKVAREADLQERLNYLISDASFANELFELICKLSFPERAYGTLLSVAKSTRSFEKVTFRDKASSLSSARDSTPPAKTTPRPCNLSEARNMESPNTCDMPASPLTPVTPMTPLTPLTPLTPAESFPPWSNGAFQEVALLIDFILRQQLPPENEIAWYSFGFVCTRDEAEEQLLAGLYAVLIQDANSMQTIFHELHHALETHSLAALFVSKGYESFRESFPHLEAFLSTPPERRPTVWRLKQFIQQPYKTEPPACLRRDYGFRMCSRREEVVRLKDIYSQVLNSMKPEDLHTACLYGRLCEAARREGVHVSAKDERLMQNDYPSPLIGFDDDAGLTGYRLPLFRKQDKLWT